jgi:hypothetical protein
MERATFGLLNTLLKLKSFDLEHFRSPALKVGIKIAFQGSAVRPEAADRTDTGSGR